jgi:hypothetical protein
MDHLDLKAVFHSVAAEAHAVPEPVVSVGAEGVDSEAVVMAHLAPGLGAIEPLKISMRLRT